MIKRLTVIMGICFVILTGCSGIDHRLDDMAEEYIKRVSEIEEEQNYQRYVALRDAGELNENGEYEYEYFDENENENEKKDNVNNKKIRRDENEKGE